MDFDGDGILDLVSGSYDPGELYLFRGLGKGVFAARETIKDKSGKPILRVPDQKANYESFGSWMAMVDWDDDGDLDILVGTFTGTMFVRRNEGNRTKPSYTTTNEWVKVGMKPLRVPGGEHANPVIVDWDGDGLWDIVTGSGNGGVYWYRNTGKKRQPQFTPPVALVPKHEGWGYSEILDSKDGPKPGIRSQIAVIDYDGDGKLDVLLGDFCTYLHLKKDLNENQRQEFAIVRKKQEDVSKHLRDSMEGLRERYKALMKGIPQSDWNTKENQDKWQKMYAEMRQSPEYKKHMAEYESLQKQVQPYVEAQKKQAGPSGPDVPHGYVWLFRRK